MKTGSQYFTVLNAYLDYRRELRLSKKRLYMNRSAMGSGFSNKFQRGFEYKGLNRRRDDPYATQYAGNSPKDFDLHDPNAALVNDAFSTSGYNSPYLGTMAGF
jgi:hypothetical protein